MTIKELALKNFGKFSKKTFCFGDGLNVIYGPNEAGKTTIYTFLGAMLFGLDKQRGRAARTDTYTTYQPWENKTWYEGELRFEIKQKIFSLERNFYHGEKSARLVCETDGEELSVEQGDLKMLLGEVDAGLFFNTMAVGQLKTKPQDLIYGYLKNYIANVQENETGETNVVKVLEILEKRKKELEQQKKKRMQEIKEQLGKCEARLEFLQTEIQDYQLQLENLSSQRQQAVQQTEGKNRGLFSRLCHWLKKIFLGRSMKKQEAHRKEQLVRLREKESFYQELLAEREALLEEMSEKRELLYEKLEKRSEDQMLEAVTLAMERIQQVSTEQKERVMDRLLEKASAVLRHLTQGKYEKLMLEEETKPVVWDGKRKLQLFQMSAGCIDQIYLSLRIALQDLFFQEEQLPLIFDDAFVYFDEIRLERLLGYLSSLNRQVFLFSCHKREMELLERRGIAFEKILLQPSPGVDCEKKEKMLY